MSGSDILSLVSLLVSAFAFFVALLTYVYTVALRPRLKLLFGEQLALHCSSSKQLYIWSNFAFFNEGAKPGAIVEFAGIISASDGRNQSLRWDAFVSNKNIAEPGTAPQKLFVHESQPETIVVTGREVETKGIQLVTDKSFVLTEGCYRLKLQGLVGPTLTRWCKTEADLVITPKNVEFLHRYSEVDPSTGTYERTLRLRRQKQFKKNFVSELLRPIIPVFES